MIRPRGFTELLNTVALPPSVRAEVVRRMAEPWRGYHGLEHLAVLWSRHRRYARGGPMASNRMARLIAVAILFHDTVLVPGATDNELRSAALWQRAARRLHGFTPAEIAWVSGTILATADHLGTPLQPRGLGWARSWMLDLDLTPIGEEAAWFRRNSRGLRAEARHMDEAAYDCGQIKFLAKLEAAPEILRTPRLKAAFETRARTNIAAETRRAARRTAKRNGGAK